jgi:hypothetical protein
MYVAENVNLTHKDQNISIYESENRWNITLVSYDTVTTRLKPSITGRLSHYSWSIGIVDDSHRYNTKNSVRWKIVTNASIGCKHQVTATPGFFSLGDWCYQPKWLF